MVKANPSTKQCDLCKGDLRKYDTFYDGRTFRRSWAWMCRECWQLEGVGVGLGLGQEYDSKTNEKLRG